MLVMPFGPVVSLFDQACSVACRAGTLHELGLSLRMAGLCRVRSLETGAGHGEDAPDRVLDFEVGLVAEGWMGRGRATMPRTWRRCAARGQPIDLDEFVERPLWALRRGLGTSSASSEVRG